MSVGQNGTAVSTANPYPAPKRNSSVGTHIHKGTPESTVGGPGATEASGANLEGSSGSAPYGGPASAG